MQEYKYDIAISLCKEDVAFAGALVNSINPSLNIFFYENNQEQLITQSGPEAFGKIFKEESRVVVILSRKEWGESFYTQIESNAILDSLARRGNQHLFVIPMKKGEVPPWYPETRIYANIENHTTEELARFIEFKVTDKGGIVKPLTFEIKYEQLKNKIAEKRNLINLQQSEIAIDGVKAEIKLVIEKFNSKIEALKNTKQFFSTSHNPIDEHTLQGHCGLEEYRLYCKIIDPRLKGFQVVTTQQFNLVFSLCQMSRYDEIIEEVDTIILNFQYSNEISGWCERNFIPKEKSTDTLLLYRTLFNDKYYELFQPINSEEIIDKWFQKLLEFSSVGVNKFL